MKLVERTDRMIVFVYHHRCPYFGSLVRHEVVWKLVPYGQSVELWEKQPERRLS